MNEVLTEYVIQRNLLARGCQGRSSVWINHRADPNTAVAPNAGRRRLGLLALAFAVSWGSMLFHNQLELPLTPLDLENTGPLAVDVILFVACWRWPWSRVVWVSILVWALLNLVVGGIVTVLPLTVLPFAPEQTVEHYAVHAVYAIGQLPLVLVASGALRSLLYQRGMKAEEGGQDVRAHD